LVSIAESACKPIKDKRGTIEYRTRIAGVLAKRTLTIAYERATNH
jgi:carbon-monoxide dehydrogenase medium subunit